MKVEIRPVRRRAELAAFIELPWEIYRNDPNWIPPLRASVRELLDPRRHPFYGDGAAAQRELFLAWEGRRPIGRVAAVLNHAHNRFHHENVGFFGFFECVDRQEVASGLFSAACDWLERFGVAAVRGPMNPSTNYECGLLVKGFDRPPVLMMTYNPPYYERLVEGFGFAKVKDLYAYWSPVHAGHLDRLERVTQRVLRREPALFTRPGDLKNFRREVDLVHDIYNNAWEKNWGFVPMSDGEIDWLARELKPLVDPELLRFAFWDGEPAGFLLAVPDWNPVLKELDGSPWRHPLRTVRLLASARPRKMEGLRLITMGVKEGYRKRGIEGVLFYESLRAALDVGYTWCEYSWILEDNELTKRTVRLMDAELYKVYRVYEKPLG